MRHILLAACMSISIDTLAHAQSSTRTAEQQQALYEAHKGDFDYLLGDWEFTAVDGGKTWEKNYQQIEARRTAPARSLGPLAAKK